MSKKENIILTHSVIQMKGNIVTNMGGEKVMLNVQKGKYYNLGEVGGAVWDLIEKRLTVGELVSTLVSEYEVEPCQCEEQVISFLEALLVEGLVAVTANT
jgi:hypothetical protein